MDINLNTMKRLIILLVMALSVSLPSLSQNFVASDKTTTYTDTTTTYTYQIKDKKYPVYKSKKGAFYIYKTSKSGKVYKYYLPKDIQIKMGRVYNTTK